ncbi:MULTISPECIES: GNAT family N-acetyltransferase [unclassified Fusibacter]|uniref:GNAT family N-acetyltransferase n=1 Tax=unclassified Fusibacter TaxID=2624464 RepID=UPI0013E91F4B|nr:MULTISPECIES: GNAT family protein [unclassified Fusibacter]MCK8059002.1 GNAT family N-acetyltransferase [Fusibacter sp. A2]NPE22413.1 GNAT family N-acetyltransferase [Fusibacter sp. A1]
MKTRIEKVTKENYQELYDFETRNRLFFELDLPPRPQGYNHFETFSGIMDELLKEQESGSYIMYLIRGNEGELVGRINLSLNVKTGEKSAEVGYRMDKEKLGRGYASKALRLILEEAINIHHITVVTAGTSSKNIASQHVLVKNGFSKVGEEKKVMKVNDQWADGYLYSLRLKKLNP